MTSYVTHMSNIDGQPQDVLLSSADVAKLKNVTPATVNRWAGSGKLRIAAKAPGRRGAYLFARADVEALVLDASASSSS